MKRFRTFIKEKEPQASTRCDPSSWSGDDAKLVAASQTVEEPPATSRVLCQLHSSFFRVASLCGALLEFGDTP
ncbi:hypothetical protein VZT92_021132 [Zoarces viviparus]|uniref:Uncharacterized protein n=1 Tax=Zoarces viviparus TaxID=48416 RepID=A0AAW1EFR0_ZOAVI